MTPSTPVLVLGASGTVGHHVARRLLAAGQPVRVVGRSVARLRDLFGDEVDAVRFDLRDAGSWPAAFAGVDRMFVLRPPEVGNVRRDLLPPLAAARDAGVSHVVFLSLQGVERNRVVPHATVEAWLRSSGLSWTFVRPSFFLENLSGTHAADIRDRDAIIVPAGRGSTSFVAAEDVAAVAAEALIRPEGYRSTAWTPTGTTALDYGKVAAVLSEVLGRPVRYTRPGIPAYLRHARTTLGMPWGMALVTAAIYTAARLGLAAGTTDDIRTVLGREPLGVREWATASRAAWER